MAEPPVAPTVSGEVASEEKRSKPSATQDLLDLEVSGPPDVASEVAGARDTSGADATDTAAELDASAQPDSAETAVAAEAAASAGPAIFELSTEDSSPVEHNSTESASSTTAGTAGDWYSLDEEQANETLQQRKQEGQLEESSQQESTSTSKPQTVNWASKLSKKAGKWAGAAKTAIQAEAKLVAADAKDLALGVREGAQITIQDTKSLSKQLQRDAKSLASAAGGWRGLWRGGRKDQEPTASPEEVGSTATGSSAGATETKSVGSGAPAPEPAVDEASQVMQEEQPKPASGDAPAAVSEEGSQTCTDSPEGGSQATSDGPADGSQASTGGPAGGPAALQAIRQSWAATAEVSMTMWKDIKEANREAMQDFRSGVQELRQGVQKLKEEVQKPRQSSNAESEGVVGSDVTPSEAGAAELPAEDADPRPQDTEQGPPCTVPSSTEALDLLSAGESGDAPTPDEPDAVPGIFDPRTPAEKAFDEKAAQVAQRVEEVGGAIAAASSKLWRKTEQGLKKSLAAVPEISRGSGTPSASTTFFAPGPRAEAADGEDVRQFDDFRVLPSCRANYVELAAADLSATLPGDGINAGDAQGTASANKAAGAAARRARKIGGKIAKRSREVSSGLLKQARDLGHNVQAGAAEAAAAARSAVAAAGPSPSDTNVNNTGDEACEEDDIFEIGSEDEELFPGGDDSGSEVADAPDGLAEDDDEEEEVFSPAAATLEAAGTAAAAAAPAAAPPVAPPAAPPAASKSNADEAMMDLLFDASEMTPASTTAPATAPVPAVSADLLSVPSTTAATSAAPALSAASAAPTAPAEPVEDPFGDLLEIPSDFLVGTAAAAAPSATPPAQKAAPVAPTQQQQQPPPSPASAASAPVAAAGTSSQPATGASLDFLSAAEKELEDLFGDDD